MKSHLGIASLRRTLTALFPDRQFASLVESDSFESLGLDPVALLLLFAELEVAGNFTFPDQLLEALETFADLLYFYNVRIGQEQTAS